jgi:hypothetical protein
VVLGLERAKRELYIRATPPSFFPNIFNPWFLEFMDAKPPYKED